MRNLAILFLTILSSRVLSSHIIPKHSWKSRLLSSILDGFGSILQEKPLEYPAPAVQDISSDKPIVAQYVTYLFWTTNYERLALTSSVIVGNTYPYTIVDWEYGLFNLISEIFGMPTVL